MLISPQTRFGLFMALALLVAVLLTTGEYVIYKQVTKLQPVKESTMNVIISATPTPEASQSATPSATPKGKIKKAE